MSEQRRDADNLEPDHSQPVTDSPGGVALEALAPERTPTRGGGPRTTQGKEKSKQNALKHGIFSKVILVKGEPKAEFNALLKGLHDALHPEGEFEESLVETLAVTRWRQRRLLLAEKAEIEGARLFLREDEKERQNEQAAKLVQALQIPSVPGLMEKIQHPIALSSCAKFLLRVEDLSHNRFDDPEIAQILKILYGPTIPMQLRNELLLMYECALEDLKNLDYQRKFEELLHEQIAYLEHHYKNTTVAIERRIESKRRCKIVPDSPRMDQLLRYSASLERTFERTLNQLERIQRMRLGQPVIPPINLNVSSS